MSTARKKAAAEEQLRALERGEASGPEALKAALREQLRLHRRLEKLTRISDAYQAQLQDLNRELASAGQRHAQALSEVKTLRGFIPICAKCKRIRDDQGYWDQIEDYLARHSEAVFSHGVCPDCARELYGSLASTALARVAVGPGLPPRTAPSRRRRPREEDGTLHIRLGELLARPEHQENPLRPELAELLANHLRLLARFEKILKISDGFQAEMKKLNRALAEASRTDPLTGLLNRRGMMERFEAEQVRAERNGEPLAVIIADVDHFKAINDRYGHEVGDLVLQSIAASLRTSLRGYDACARWGGEEFLLLLPGSDLEAALSVARKLRELLAEHRLDLEQEAPDISVSMGVAMYEPSATLSRLILKADAALYRAKALGRDRVEIATADDGAGIP